MYLLHVGVPICTWQRAVRGKDADKFPKLRSYAFHLARARCHRSPCYRPLTPSRAIELS